MSPQFLAPVTDRAEGDRKLLFVSENKGYIYLIDTNMNVQFTGAKTMDKNLYNSETTFIPLFKDIFIEHFINNYQNHLTKIEKMIEFRFRSRRNAPFDKFSESE